MDYEKMIKDIMVASRDMSLKDKKRLMALLMSAYGDLSVLVTFEETEDSPLKESFHKEG